MTRPAFEYRVWDSDAQGFFVIAPRTAEEAAKVVEALRSTGDDEMVDSFERAWRPWVIAEFELSAMSRFDPTATPSGAAEAQHSDGIVAP